MFASHQVPFSQASLLTDLYERRAPQRMSTLAQTFDAAPRTVTALVDGLERRGLVQRSPDTAPDGAPDRDAIKEA